MERLKYFFFKKKPKTNTKKPQETQINAVEDFIIASRHSTTDPQLHFFLWWHTVKCLCFHLSVSQTSEVFAFIRMLFWQALHPGRWKTAAAAGLIASEVAWPRWCLSITCAENAAQTALPELGGTGECILRKWGEKRGVSTEINKVYTPEISINL